MKGLDWAVLTFALVCAILAAVLPYAPLAYAALGLTVGALVLAGLDAYRPGQNDPLDEDQK
jgi:hypothetical protein